MGLQIDINVEGTYSCSSLLHVSPGSALKKQILDYHRDLVFYRGKKNGIGLREGLAKKKNKKKNSKSSI